MRRATCGSQQRQAGEQNRQEADRQVCGQYKNKRQAAESFGIGGKRAEEYGDPVPS